MTEAHPVGREQVVVEFLRNSRELITTQREVLLGYLGAAPAVRYAVPEVIEVPARPAVTVAPPVPDVTVVSEPAGPADVRAAVLDVISDRTGFPPDMIEGDLDLEADLSIDSIKRTEIAGTLLRRLGLLDQAGDEGPDLLVRQRTANALTTQLENWLSPSRTAVDEDESPPLVPAGSVPRRYTLHLVDNPLPAPDPAHLAGKTLAVLSTPGQEELADSVRRAFGLPATPETEADVIVSLHGLVESAEAAPELFSQLKSAKGTFIAAATGNALGLSGLFRAAALERDATTRLVIVDSPSADLLVAEAAVDDGHAVVRHTAEGRMTHTLREQALGSLAHSGAGPGGGELAALGLGPDSVVAVIGGARGITARAAVALAASGCRIEFAGRTVLTGDDDLPDGPRAMREALIARGGAVADIERRVRTTLAQREIGRTLAEVGNAAYHSLDVRDEEAVRQFVKQFNGRLDGVIYAAGVIDDKLMGDKDETSFRTVFDTKVAGARTLLSALADEGLDPGFVAFFGSISAVLGNRGQTDYAAGNHALETLAAQWPGRAVTVHWGPWAPDTDHSGMVTPELAREYQRREVALIDPAEGTSALLRELAYGDVNTVLYTAALW